MEGLKLMPQIWNLYLLSLPQDLLVIIVDFVEGRGCTLTTWFFFFESNVLVFTWEYWESQHMVMDVPCTKHFGCLKTPDPQQITPLQLNNSFPYEVAESIANTNNTLHHKTDVFVFTPAIYFLIPNVIHLIYAHFWKSYLSMWQEKIIKI